MDWNAASLWLSLINIYDCRRKLNKASGVILNSLWSQLAGLRTNSEARSEGVMGTVWFQFSSFPHPFFYAAWDLQPWQLRMLQWLTASLTFFSRFLYLCDWISEGRFSFLSFFFFGVCVGAGLCPKVLVLEPSIIALLSVAMLCICHLLILYEVGWFEFFHLRSWGLMR